jgi:uncharacterized protein (TIGR02145 family)
MKNLISFILLVTIVTTSCNNNATTEKKEVKIGPQTWMTENLNVDKFQNGDPIPEVKRKEDWEKAAKNGQPAWCYYDNNPSNGEKYGKLYNWYAVNDPRGLAPKGWRIPTKDDFIKLLESLGDKPTSKFLNSDNEETTYSGKSLLESGMNCTLGGNRTHGLNFEDDNNTGYWWSSDGLDSNIHYYYSYNSSGSLRWSRGRGERFKENGFSVCCIKDSNVTKENVTSNEEKNNILVFKNYEEGDLVHYIFEDANGKSFDFSSLPKTYKLIDENNNINPQYLNKKFKIKWKAVLDNGGEASYPYNEIITIELIE